MENVFINLLRLSILFGRNVIGCLNSPYVTYRGLSQEKTDIKQTLFIPLLVLSYFAFTSVIRTGVSNPFLLTLKFNTLVLAAGVGFTGMILFLYLLGRLIGGKGRISQIYLLWSFTLIPTLTWFFTTSLLYIFLPPPRTFSFLGKLYSVIFIVFSLSVFFWKLILYYLTLRFGFRLDLWRIGLVSLIITPLIVSYSLLMYRLGIFRIPFI